MALSRTYSIVIAAIVALAATYGVLRYSSSSQGARDEPMAVDQVKIGDRQFRVELAITPRQHQRGLQNRTSLAPDAGMLFILGQVEVAEFWMKDTLIPLDMIFLDAGGRVVKAHMAAQPCRSDPCPGYSSGQPVQYVLELAAGQGADLKPGDQVELPPAAKR